MILSVLLAFLLLILSPLACLGQTAVYPAPAQLPSGGGTTNLLAKFSNAGQLGNSVIADTGTGPQVRSVDFVCWSSSATDPTVACDVLLKRSTFTSPAALYLSNGTNAQTFMISNTDDGAGNFERFLFQYQGNVVRMDSTSGGTGVNRDIIFARAEVEQWRLKTNGTSFDWVPGATNTQNIGSSSLRPLQHFAGTSGIDSTGPILLELGGSTSQSSAIGTANAQTGSVGCTNAGTDDTLFTYSLPAAALSANNRAVRISTHGTAANNANAKTVKLFFGATAIESKALTAAQTDTWVADGIVFRTGAATQEARGTLLEGGTATITDVTQSGPTETLSGAVVIKVTGNCTGANDILGKSLLIEMLN